MLHALGPLSIAMHCTVQFVPCDRGTVVLNLDGSNVVEPLENFPIGIRRIVFVESPNPSPGPSLTYSEMFIMKSSWRSSENIFQRSETNKWSTSTSIIRSSLVEVDQAIKAWSFFSLKCTRLVSL